MTGAEIILSSFSNFGDPQLGQTIFSAGDRTNISWLLWQSWQSNSYNGMVKILPAKLRAVQTTQPNKHAILTIDVLNPIHEQQPGPRRTFSNACT